MGSTPDRIRIIPELLGAFNIAAQQNRISFIRGVKIQNPTDTPLSTVVLSIRAEPEFMREFNLTIDYIPAEREFSCGAISPDIDYNLLSGLTERVDATLYFELKQAESLIASTSAVLPLLAYDEWQGSAVMPELLCAFVTPNHPKLSAIIGRTSELLNKWTGSPSHDAYQSKNPDRVLATAAAIYGAILELNIVYAVGPAHFEEVGQRIRLVENIIDAKLGNCIELSLLYAACLEAVGLSPLLCLTDDHVFAGVWLIDATFPETVVYDPSLVSKRLASGVNEVAVVECTYMTAGRANDINSAMATAAATLSDKVKLILDVKRARMSGIRPIAQRFSADESWNSELSNRDESELTGAPAKLGETVNINFVTPDEAKANAAPDDRLSLWKRKLLDLGLRNSLVNLRQTKGMVPLLVSSVPELEDSLADGADFGILPCPKEFERSEAVSPLEYSGSATGISEVLASELANARLRATLTEGDLARSMTELYRAARLSIEENGTNTLYIALGMLRWYETTTSTKPRYAPLLLIPVEIVHKTTLRGYIIRRRDEDAQFNITLLEMLRQDFGIDVSLPEMISFDEHGVDVHGIFTVIRRAVMELARWDVVETAALGIFSFTQFVMWNDLVSRIDDIRGNKIVSSLIDGKLAWQTEPMSIGDHVPEDGVYLPISADASQLYAVERAAAGDSFVLHGPPGTGKSQTITLLIANALAKGKTILFVAEKLAALQVVEKRLDSLGIGAFCLELHSNKSRKRDLVEQLREAAEAKRALPDDHWQKIADSTAEKRRELDAYAEALHTKRRSGMSLFELVGEYERVDESVETIKLDRGFAALCDTDALSNISGTMRSIAAMSHETGHPATHPLLRIRASSYDINLRDSSPRLMTEYRSILGSFRPVALEFCELVGQPKPTEYDGWCELRELAGLLGFWKTVPRAWAECSDIPALAGQIHRLCAHARTAHELRGHFSGWRESVFLLDAQSLYNDWNRASADWFLPKLIGQGKVIKQLALHTDQKPDKSKIPELLSDLIKYRDESESVRTLAEKLSDSLGSLYNENEDLTGLDELAYAAEGNASRISELGADDVRTGMLTDAVVQSAKKYCELFDKLAAIKAEVYGLLLIEDPDGDYIEDELRFCDQAIPHLSELKLWCGWNKLRDRAISLGIGEAIDAFEGRGRVPVDIDSLEPVVEKSVLKALIEYTIDTDTLLCEFTGALFSDKINRFKELCEQLESLARTEIYARIASRLPDLSREASQSSEVGILQRAIRSGGRGVSIRKLFLQLPNLLPRLCPCMLMSPISAAQYLDPKRKPFDIVVFDEASQLPTCKAVGVIARGESAIIVGDPKQMPPTSFFSQSANDDELAETDDLENILDDCLALNLPETHLTWHYRSMHESLIAFSNSRFYENRLYTFPSVNDRESMVKAVHVDGIFDRGRTRTNRAEAEAVVAELKRRASDPILSCRSVGVVTFNISQQNLIEDLLDDACAADGNFDEWVNGDEPVFIKNLENVQGDERDVILFSVAFAPDREGNFYMNFGPLNRDGGWRRLNVAVSRAKYEMVVFTSIRPEQIDTSRSSSEGVAALRAFLEYADGRPLPETAATARGAGHGGLAERIAKRLSELGYKTQCAVGHSAYRVDVAVVDPYDPNRYILGVMLDGENYVSAKTTRDREISQFSVLRRLGWNIYRVWTPDWWENDERELGRIVEAIGAAMSLKCGNTDSAAVNANPEVIASGNAVGNTDGNTTSVETDGNMIYGTTDSKMSADIADKDISSDRVNVSPDPETENAPLMSGKLESELNSIQTIPSQNCPTIPYRQAGLDMRINGLEELMLETNLPVVREMIQSVIDAEAPIYEQLLTRRILQSCGISRAGARVQNYLVGIYASMRLMTTFDSGGKLYWRQDQSPVEYRCIRAGGDERREIEQIPDCELENAIVEVLTLEVGLPRDDLIREAAKLLGFSRLGANLTGRIGDAITRLAGRGEIRIDENGGCAIA